MSVLTALFGVELHPVEIVFLHGNAIAAGVVTLRHCGIVQWNKIGMHQIHITILFYAFKYSLLSVIDLVPTHLRYFDGIGKAPYFKGEYPQGCGVAFLRQLTEQLHAQTDAQNGLL